MGEEGSKHASEILERFALCTVASADGMVLERHLPFVELLGADILFGPRRADDFCVGILVRKPHILKEEGGWPSQIVQAGKEAPDNLVVRASLLANRFRSSRKSKPRPEDLGCGVDQALSTRLGREGVFRDRCKARLEADEEILGVKREGAAELQLNGAD